MSSEEGTVGPNRLLIVATAIPFDVYDTPKTSGALPSMAVIGLVGDAGRIAHDKVARRAPALATLEYGVILSATALGHVIFGAVPTVGLWLDARLFLLSGIRRVAHQRRRTAAIGQRPPRVLDLGTTNALHQEGNMADATHDLVVNYIAKTRFPFPGQTTWAADYQTLTNVPARKRSIPTPAGDHYPDIVILDGTGRVRELGEVEMTVDASSLTYLKAGSTLADRDTPTKVSHFFVYVPAGKEAAAQKLLEDNDISYAGVRGFTVNANGTVKIVPFVTKGDPYDHQTTDPTAT